MMMMRSQNVECKMLSQNFCTSKLNVLIFLILVNLFIFLFVNVFVSFFSCVLKKIQNIN